MRNREALIMFTRREFVAAGAVTLLASRSVPSARQEVRPLAFSTLGCPKWELSKILEFARYNGFAAVELRGLMGNLDLPSRPEFVPERIAQAKKEIADSAIKIACVSSSTELHIADATERAKGIADGQRFIDLAQALGAPNVRVFGNKFEGGSREAVIARVAAGMHEMAEYAGPRGVTVIIESHGDFVDSPTLKEVLTRANSEYAGLLWDAHHTFVDGHEDPEHTVAELGKWIRHTHLKDSVRDGKERKYVLTGTGQVPIDRQVQALRKMGYKGYYCFEWEKVWHPDLLDPEVAFPDYVRVMTDYLNEPLAAS
jgi:sugar phosphate isomerase/epimerase